ncbi:MAG TPA: hypothetical protein ENK18_21225 [Deltaproteobacteria bacterium]|nr:hypothetical protein [Deltaproteobacteria bacterium]
MLVALWGGLAAAAPLVVAAPQPPPGVGQHVSVRFTDGELSCALPGDAVVESIGPKGVSLRLGTIARAWADWLGARGSLGVAGAQLPACEGIPSPFVIHVPPAGRVLAVRAPIEQLDVGQGAVAVVGPDPTWLVVWPAPHGIGEVVVRHGDGPPTPFELHRAPPAPAPVTDPLRIPVGGAVALQPADAWAALPDHPGLVVQTFAGQLLLIGRSEASLVGFVGESQPEPVWIEVGGGFGAAPSGPVASVGVGRTRRFRLDRPMVEALVVSPELATVTLRPWGMKITGLAPGQTQLILSDGAALHWVRLTLQ